MLSSTPKREGLLDEIKRENSTVKNRPKCGVALVLSELLDVDRADLLEALENKNLRSSVISKVLKSRGFYVSEFSIRRHKLKRCLCGSTK